MSVRDLGHLTDREIMIVTYQLLQDHLDEHRWWTSAYRWAVVALLGLLTAATSLLGTLGVIGQHKP